MVKAYVFKSVKIDQYLTEFHEAGRKSDRPIAFGASQLPNNDYEHWNGEQVFKTPQEAQARIKEHVTYFKTNYPKHTDLDQESDFAVYEVKLDFDEDTYIDDYWAYVSPEPEINYHLRNPVLIVRRCPDAQV
jgi:hypothetical protein